ncbi:aminotransferase class I/II-fold pyridoxal phosphate-dependent enzyme [Ponticoccus sp. SC2-23]|uniref:pyridoxal phosphate-dependent aminotransferase n=1 Tax=Alexandriicola marinus TaxID=2081710 RepID=UPI000FDAC962|nr:aminotransferase class I/II-fold pyridoxal phosphate-dependent enzyme [Alexandriicola marinus]MBM1219311.1 aminotransferase class I/II-fold pyridoxal phosphate-dependent enzyme [Ponticoccus sp. SC6-9]MBM1223617.1 aminotransferase class I/II-fold pyridoxal phosphate-dependent enzyme [Ponticoccus sp. SC6-15]MBM1229124.1 aminotransferase class I/II-fold pyridoxal phosphate-dependent enzyme [Ponticoccus sp. SC6-38]MBM1232583.1 aminotransferase class I/II-fold pyridoxal phosphate-dependent enzyme
MRNSTRGLVDPFIVMDVMEAARAAEEDGRHIIHMEVGQPSTGAPAAALARLSDELARDPMGYTVALGMPELRARIARHMGEWYNVDVDPARVIVTAGASGAFILAFTALFDPGARVGLGLPCYPSYRQILRALDLEPVGLRTSLEARMQPRPADLSGQYLDGLIVASPGNPTGSMLGKMELAALAEACEVSGIPLISDEIYHGLSYAQRSVSALEVTDEVYVVNSFSKYFSMTGWRVGWMVVPEDHVRIVERLAQNMFICPPHASQRLALAAMDCEDELQANVAVYARNRDLLLDGLARAGFATMAPPDGAFYIYADVSAHTDDALAFSSEILDRAGVAVTPGLDFDPEDGHHWLRFSYARATADIEEGIERLTRFMDERRSA